MGHQVRGETDDRVGTAGGSQFLLDFGHVPVFGHAVGRHALACLAEQGHLLEPASGPGNAGLGVDDDVGHVDRARARQRQQAQQRRRRVAAGTGDQPRRGNRRAVVFGQPVYGLALHVERGMGTPVPLLVGAAIAQAEVGRHVDEAHVRMGVEHRPGDILRGTVRQPAEDDIDLRPVGLVHGGQVRQAGETQVREHLGHGLAGVGVGGQRGDFHVRMGQRQTHDIRTGVAGSAENADPQNGVNFGHV